MRCYECGGTYKQKHGTVNLTAKAIGNYCIDDIDYKECEGCGSVFLSKEAWVEADRKENEVLENLIGRLPVSEFVNATTAAAMLDMSRQGLHQHNRIRRGFVYSIKIDGHTLYHRGSVILFNETKDGRFPLISEQRQPEVKYIFVTIPSSSSDKYERQSYQKSEASFIPNLTTATYNKELYHAC